MIVEESRREVTVTQAYLELYSVTVLFRSDVESSRVEMIIRMRQQTSDALYLSTFHMIHIRQGRYICASL